MSLEDILQRGRWASTKSARHHIQAGRSLLLSMTVPPKMARWGATLSRLHLVNSSSRLRCLFAAVALREVRVELTALLSWNSDPDGGMFFFPFLTVW